MLAAESAPTDADASPPNAPLGLVAVEDFRQGSADDDATVAAAMTYAAGQTYKPALVFANRVYDLTRPLRAFSGLHLMQFPFGDEFQHSQVIKVPEGGLLGFDPHVRSITLENLSCQVRDHLLEPIPRDAAGGAWTDVRVLGGGYNGGAPLLDGAFLRLSFQPTYVNNVTDSVLRIGGSDSWLFTRGPHYVSGVLPANRPFLDLDNLGQSVIGSVYITAQGGYGILLSGKATGLVLDGVLIDATGREDDDATQLAGLQILGGTDITINDLWVFNANVSGGSAGLVTVRGGSEIVFVNPRFPGVNGDTRAADTTSACIDTTVPITVMAPKAVGRAKLITAVREELVTLVGAPEWQVRARP
ncbi:hypothetical protein SAMN05660642_04914 [Geodermatophilus siccatus]|uniref:Pectate lyase superfamily protein n=1 Tax=Geodermatophilus siccatus TaxID=1137991 RepID=A0A1H0BQL8_9ACTN|nr:hypothetical protein SAMN05660642_04914 [Geodermatophilus siccatus]